MMFLILKIVWRCKKSFYDNWAFGLHQNDWKVSGEQSSTLTSIQSDDAVIKGISEVQEQQPLFYLKLWNLFETHLKLTSASLFDT